MTLEEILARLDVFFWGPGTLLLVLGTGVFFLIRLRFLPWRNLGYALTCALGRDARKAAKPGALSPFASLMTALAATHRHGEHRGGGHRADRRRTGCSGVDGADGP